MSKNYKYYRTNSGRDILDIPLVELQNVICETLAEQVAIREDELTLLSAKKLGFTRRGTNVDSALRKALQVLSTNEIIESIGDNVRLRQVSAD